MKKFLILIPFFLLCAETPEEKIKILEQKVIFARLKEAVLQEQILTSELSKIQTEKQNAFAEVCKNASLPVDPTICLIDWQKNKVTKAEEKTAEKKK